MQEGDLPRRAKNYFPIVKESDSGLYTCIISYLYHGQIYNMTSMLELKIRPNSKTNADLYSCHLKRLILSVFLFSLIAAKTWKTAVITSPQPNGIFHVDLGEPRSRCMDALFNLLKLLPIPITSHVNFNFNFLQAPQ